VIQNIFRILESRKVDSSASHRMLLRCTFVATDTDHYNASRSNSYW